MAFLLLFLVILKAAINLAQLKLFRHYYVMVSTDIIHCLPPLLLHLFSFHTFRKLWCPEGITLSSSVLHCFEIEDGFVVDEFLTSFPLQCF